MTPVLLKTMYANYFNNTAISHICACLLESMRGPQLNVECWVEQFDPEVGQTFFRPSLPRTLYRLACKSSTLHQGARRLLERRYLNSLREGDIAYLWPRTSLKVYQGAKARGAVVVAERINCHRATAQALLREAYGALGWPEPTQWTDEAVREETAKMEQADFIFAPSPPVAESLRDAGIPEDKVLRASYGWDPRRFENRSGSPERRQGKTTFLFVGSGCVRKGLPRLLKMWARAQVDGRLLIAGNIDQEVASRCSDLLNRDDVVSAGFAADISKLYASADVFAFPTHEEGSPLVSYEAAGSSLPFIVSPMGAGDFIRDGKEGLVMDPYDDDAWVDAMRHMAGSPELREEMGRNASSRAREFTWDKVGARRREQLLAKVGTSTKDNRGPRGTSIERGQPPAR
jgi:glycosyltransferase involved in cell wall biosynthesis